MVLTIKHVKEVFMKSEDADVIVVEYLSTIKEFAYSKEKNVDNAEELASRIVHEVYISLLKVDSIKNVKNYIFTISNNVYTKYINEDKKTKRLSDDLQTIINLNSDIESKSHTIDHSRLRNEISYLDKVQREVINMYFFKRMSINEIVDKIDIPKGRVKWLLYKAKNTLKENMLTPNKNNKLIKFSGVGQEGTYGNNGEHIDTYFEKPLPQNIAYSAYYKPKSIQEIARDLCIPAARIEDIIKQLIENSYINKVGKDKYLTNFLIIESAVKSLIQKDIIYNKYAKYVCDLYIPLLFKAIKNIDNKIIYTPKNNFNFLMWSVISYACKFKLTLDDRSTFLKKFHVKRKDGSENFAFAWIEKDLDWQELGYIKKLFDVLEDINSYNPEQKKSWQFNTLYDTRKADLDDYIGVDFDNLYDHLSGKITNNPDYSEKYFRLHKKRYLVKTKKKDYVNIVIVSKTENEFLNILPNMPTKLKRISKELDKEMFELDKILLPEHMHDISQAWNTDILTSSEIRIRILEQLLKNGILKPLTINQKATVNTIMFSDLLPG